MIRYYIYPIYDRWYITFSKRLNLGNCVLTRYCWMSSVLGFGCSCAEHSVPIGIDHCRPCNATEVVSTDGTACVPRRCQNVSGRVACRKCPGDYITGDVFCQSFYLIKQTTLTDY